MPIKLSDRLSKLGYASYKEYLNSQHWYRIKDKFYGSDRVTRDSKGNVLCSSCNKAKPTEVHHLTYKSLGKEELIHLIALCRDCHQAQHKHRNYKGGIRGNPVEEAEQIRVWIETKTKVTYRLEIKGKAPSQNWRAQPLSLPKRIQRAISRKPKGKKRS